ncbi:putative fatty acyl-CoA reductase CG5065 [Venturia canescens]|uniref:putative fatty acyl-CoA reductase CG5065 n=1 Tax=Venturia canescens TaxID=32260 RepID=UPI001C9BFC90|nr:putative fatty acyl-CoA reductase CG5065 [Venturia canescens]XP_043290167.1 putative fatty acyl-CoA reductase CG5065 [Venturia canescens]XP_043290177.1 putative fatty acyl-CoA reductase CG5065 [Venturia canescens]XP_043290186.1 putative fatty acyl-CoA reductase CG5065 [Venturia canescens]
MGTANAQTGPERVIDEANPSGASIEAFFADKVILITGATGFLGKALLEKLLRSCPRVASIYILLRPKKGQTVEQRLKHLIGNQVFDRVRWEFPGALNKIFALKGDVGLPGLGLSHEDRTTLAQRVNVVFHSAASVRFDEPLKAAVNLNTKGTERIVELCRAMGNLISLIHVSTAYSNADQREIKESIYSPKVKPQTIMEMCENLDDETIALIEKKLMGQHPNTYTLTKGLAENLIMTEAVGLPVAIVRPSIVGAAYQEPFPGWVDNICGVTGILMEVGRGTIRSIVCNGDLVVDVIPVDYVVDTLICACWHSAMGRNNKIMVYNCTSGSFNPVTWARFKDLTQKHAVVSPSKHVLWYPGVTFRTNEFMHKLMAAMLHQLPAFIVDLMLRFQGGKPMMMKVSKRFERAAKVGQFFTVNEWKFQIDNMRALAKNVKVANDANSFNVDVSNLDWDSYMHQYMLGIRKYLLKDNPETLSDARNRLFKLYWVHKITQALSVIILFKMVSITSR